MDLLTHTPQPFFTYGFKTIAFQERRQMVVTMCIDAFCRQMLP